MINIMVEDNNDTLYQFDEQTGEPSSKKVQDVDIETVRAKLPRLKAEREEMMKEEFRTVVVHEFGDEYHLSEEERKRSTSTMRLLRLLVSTNINSENSLSILKQ